VLGGVTRTRGETKCGKFVRTDTKQTLTTMASMPLDFTARPLAAQLWIGEAFRRPVELF